MCVCCLCVCVIFVCVISVCVVCVVSVCVVSVWREEAEAGGGRRIGRRMRHRKEERHNKMWGTSEYSNHNGGTHRRPPQTTAEYRRQPQTTQQPEPLTEHGGSQSAAPARNSAAPATNSACQETSEYSNHNGGTDRRPPQTTADNRRQRNSESL